MDIQITPASASDANAAARLTFMAYHKFSYDIFGEVGEAAATEYFRKLWQHGNNRFGYRYSYVAKLGTKPDAETVAIMTCYPAPLIKKLVRPTLWQLIHSGRASFLFHFITHLSNFYHFSNNQEFMDDEFYIATLSVLPEYRGKKIGAQMLRHARALTAQQNLRRCTLHVNAQNEGGIRFYERNGFKKAPPLQANAAYYRMVFSI